jgi:hypothetical protein
MVFKWNDSEDNKIVLINPSKFRHRWYIILSHKGQAVALKGKIKDRINKDLQLTFQDVDLFKITPANDQFVFQGI